MIDPFRFTVYIFALGLNLPTVVMVMGSSFKICLPKDITLNDVISATVEGAVQSNIAKLTMEQRLIELKAYCKNGLLTDGTGKRMTFYKLTGCWGNPPFNYQDILKRQDGEIEKLKKHYTVIEITCNPSGVPIP